MRILIADDTAAVPQAFSQPQPAASGGKSAKKYGDIGEAMTLTCALAGSATTRAAMAPGGVDEDGCPPQGPIPACSRLDLQDQPELLATVLDALGQALLNRGCLQEGKKLIQLALDIRLKHFGEDHPATAASFNSRARVLRMEDDLLGAAREVNRALKINRRVFGRNGLPVAVNLNELGAIQLYLGKFADARKAAREGQTILRKLGLKGTDPNWTRLLDVEGRALVELGKLPAAEKVLAEAVSIDLKQVGKHHPKYATHLGNLAVVRWMNGDLRAARRDLLEAIDVYVTVLGRPAHPNLIDLFANLGSVLVNLGSFTEAHDFLCKALGLNRQLRGPDHTLVGNDHANLGRLHFKMNNLSEAKTQFDKALAVYKQNVSRGTLPRKHPYIAEVRIWLDRIKKPPTTRA